MSGILCVLVFVTFVSTPVISREARPCREDQRQCPDGSCISLHDYCVGDGATTLNVTRHTRSYKPSKNPSICVLPPQPANGLYRVAGVKEPRPGQVSDSFDLTVVCRRGFGIKNSTDGVDGFAVQQVFCVNGKWSQDMPKCVRFCKLEPDPSVQYTCQFPGMEGFRPCKKFLPPGVSVRPKCNAPLYHSTESLLYMTCHFGFWNHIAKCSAECGRVTPGGEVLLTDGKKAKRGEVPWHLGVYRKNTTYEQICGASLVSNNIALSAAHCFWSDAFKQLPASNYVVAAGKVYRDWSHENDLGAQISDVKEIRIPKLFEGEQANYQADIAVLVLETPIVYKPHVKPVCLHFEKMFERWQLHEGKIGKVAGWGLTGANGNYSTTLQVVDFPYVDINVCIKTLPQFFREYITVDKFCAGYTNGAALCHGDSGGGLAFPVQDLNFDRYYLRGIVSSAPSTNKDQCNVETYTTFTKVSNHEDFVQEVIAANTKKNCLSYAFQCDDGTCVDQGSDCNGEIDCPDGSDEADELCNLSALISTIPGPERCVLPDHPPHGHYQVANSPDAKPGQSLESLLLTMNCDEGYRMVDEDGNLVEGNVHQVFCVMGKWYQQLPTCVRYCKIERDPTVTLMCATPGSDALVACGSDVAPGVKVKPVCNTPNYYSTTALADMTCLTDGLWDYIARCKPECGRVTPHGAQLVSGGVPAKFGEIPWHVGMYSKKTKPFKYICGGTIISNEIVLSGALCFWDQFSKRTHPSSDYAVAGAKLYRHWNNSHDVNAQRSDVREIKVPDIFQGELTQFHSDLAIVFLETPFVYKPYLRPVCLEFDRNLERKLQYAKIGKVAGWGLTEANGEAADILQVVDYPYVPLDACFNHLDVSFWKYIAADKFCAGSTNGTALCKGDSGGGYTMSTLTAGNIERHYLWGIVSVAPRSDDLCNVNSYTALTRITNQEEFITKYFK